MLLLVSHALLKLYCSCVVFDWNSIMSAHRGVFGGASCSTWPTLEVIWEDDEPLRESYTWLTIGWHDKRAKERLRILSMAFYFVVFATHEGI